MTDSHDRYVHYNWITRKSNESVSDFMSKNEYLPTAKYVFA